MRWIDVEGFNAKIVQHLLAMVDCDRQFIFNNIVDTKQRVMGLVLDGVTEEKAKFLLVTKVASLSKAASQQIDGETTSGKLFDIKENIVEYEQISYLLYNENVVQQGIPTPGTLISFQQGKEGDVFGELRQRLKDGARERRRGASFLLLQLVRASSDSAGEIEHYFETALEQLDTQMQKRPSSLFLANKARSIESECDTLRRTMAPFPVTLEWMTKGSQDFPEALLGKSRVPWVDLHMQQKRLIDNIEGSQATAKGLVEGYRDRQAKKNDQSMMVISLVLAIFSPLSFISGIYGMNFNGTIPELEWTRENSVVTGYEYFWILIGVIVASIIILYMMAGLIPGPISMFRKLRGDDY